jgi:hypothetical protein
VARKHLKRRVSSKRAKERKRGSDARNVQGSDQPFRVQTSKAGQWKSAHLRRGQRGKNRQQSDRIVRNFLHAFCYFLFEPEGRLLESLCHSLSESFGWSRLLLTIQSDNASLSWAGSLSAFIRSDLAPTWGVSGFSRSRSTLKMPTLRALRQSVSSVERGGRWSHLAN